MGGPRLVSWELPALLSDTADSRVKSRRRHHREFLASLEQKPRVSKPTVEQAPKADRGKVSAKKARA